MQIHGAHQPVRPVDQIAVLVPAIGAGLCQPFRTGAKDFEPISRQPRRDFSHTSLGVGGNREHLELVIQQVLDELVRRLVGTREQ